MTERPILFSAEMVRAILRGDKTQTRRKAPIRELKILQHPGDMLTWSVSFLKAIKGTLASHSGGKFSDLQARSIIASQFNPYGKPGDTLWVREACWAESTFDGDGIRYAADHAWRIIENTQEASEAWCKLAQYGGDDALDNQTNIGRRVPSIHMPRWASRITLRITDVRVERLQNISEDDARAEGMLYYSTLSEASGENLAEAQTRLRWRQRQFASFWNHINGLSGWEANPWVWVLSFERVKP